MGPPIRPIIIAHRGACGYLPEHTLAAKALAYEMRSDYLEQDVVATRDDELVVIHDIHLDRVSNVANLFPGRKRRDGRFYVRDFALAEIKRLTVRQRVNADGSPVYPQRSLASDENHQVQTFAEELTFIAELQANGGRPVGIYPEIKRPAWHRDEGVDITALFLDVLRDFNYVSHGDPVYVQCFDDHELRRLRETHHCELKLIQLIGDNSWNEAATDYDLLLSDTGLAQLSATVDGIGPWLNHVYDLSENGRIVDAGLVSRAHDRGLAVHPFTFRKDDLPPGFTSFTELVSFAVDELSIDGLFTDFPDIARTQDPA